MTCENSPIKINANKITEEKMQLLGSSKKEIDQDKDGELVPKIEIVDVVLIHCNVVNNTHQQKSRVLFSFVPDK